MMPLDSRTATETQGEEYVTPFAGMSAFSPELTAGESEQVEAAEASPFESFTAAETPFTSEEYNELEEAESAVRDFLEALHDEDFEDALEELLNEGAARSLADTQQWSVAPSEGEANEALERWLAPLVTEWERTIDGFAAGLENAQLETMPEHELEQLLESLESESAFESEIFGKALKALARKAKNAIKTVVKVARNPIKGLTDIAKAGLGTIAAGVKGLGKLVVGPLLNKLKSIGVTLLKGVLRKLVRPLTRLLPASVRPLVPLLTKALGVGESETGYGEQGYGEQGYGEQGYGAWGMSEFGLGETGFGETGPNGSNLGETSFAEELARAFDSEVTAMMFAPEADEDTLEQFHFLENYENPETYESPEAHESWESAAGGNELADLDAARARLASALGEHSGAEVPVGPIQEFLPALLAVRPLLKLGLKVTGARSKLIDLLATPIASLIRSALGPANMRRFAAVAGHSPDRMIARAGVGLAFTALGLETGTSAEQALPGEALASAVEATANRVLDELPAEALADPLQVSAAVQRFFAESAAAYLPDRLLRGDLPELETADEGGMWVMMPRSTGPRYRFRKYTRLMRVPISRQAARFLPWRDGGTLEHYLLDLGVPSWPVQAEVDLYEAMPGSMVGHFTRDETIPTGENPSDEEYQELTPEVAGILLGESGLGRLTPVSVRHGGALRVAPGRRYYRIRVGQFPARRSRRPRRQVGVRWDPTARRLRVAIRLSERRARILQAQLQRSAPAGQRNLPAVLTSLRAMLVPRLQARITRRMLRSGSPADRVVAPALAARASNAAMSGLSRYLVQRSAQFAAAIANSAEGVTIVLTFNGVSARGAVQAPEVVAHPGWIHA
jgi:hypothetical protein